MKSKILPALVILLSALLFLLGSAARIPRADSLRTWLLERKKVLVLQGSNFENRQSNPGKAHGSEKQEKNR